MTLTATDHWTRIQPEQARDPLLDEMHDAGRNALRSDDPMVQAFYTGLFTGYAVGFGLVTREALDRARREPWSSNVHIDFWRPNSFAEPDTAWACGVRHGYYLATSERTDADECAMCGERLIDSLDDVEYCDDGSFCGMEDCKRVWHANGPTTCGGDE